MVVILNLASSSLFLSQYIIIFLQVVCFLECFTQCENDLRFRGLVKHFRNSLMLQIYSQNCLGCWVFTKHLANNLIFFLKGIFWCFAGEEIVQFEAESKSVLLKTYAAGTKLFCIIQAARWHVCAHTMWRVTERLNCKQGVSHIFESPLVSEAYPFMPRQIYTLRFHSVT